MANPKQLSEMLKQLGWGSGFRLPIANEENMKLEELLEQKQTKLLNLSHEVQEETLAVNNITSNYKHLQTLMKHAKDVEMAKRGQMEKEKHIISLTERDLAKVEQDTRNGQKRLRSLKDRNRLLEGNLLRRKDNLGELVDTINFDKKAISEYEEKFSKEDAYMKLIEDFADTDNEKIKKCQEQYKSLGESVVTSRRRLDQTISESDILDMELESLARRFRKAHAERNEFIENWKATLDALEGRDKELIDMSEIYERTTLDMKKACGMVEKQDAHHRNIQCQTKSYLNQLSRIERQLNFLQAKKRQVQEAVVEASDVASDLGMYVVQLEKETSKVKSQLKKMDSGDQLKEKLEAVKAEVRELKLKYGQVSMEQFSSADQAKQLEEFLDKEIKKVELFTKELEKVMTLKSVKGRQAKETQKKAFLAESDIKNLNLAIVSCKKQCHVKNEVLVKLQAIGYRLDRREMAIKMKIRGIEQPETLYSAEQYGAMQKKILILKNYYDEIVKTQKMIIAQAGHCDLVHLNSQKEFQKEGEQHKRYEEYLLALQMQIRRIQQEDETTVETIKDTGVSNSLLNLQLRKMLGSIRDYETKMFDLEQERVTLHTVVKARKKDIETYTTLLITKKRAIQDESQKLRSKCLEISNEAQWKKRNYELMMMLMWKGGGEAQQGDGSGEGGRSEAYFIIKMAQEREFYKQEGDKWDLRVKEAEKIVEGLQNTLALMMGTNEVFKDSLKPATTNTIEGQKLQELKQKEAEAGYRLKVVRDQRNEYLMRLETKRLALDNLNTVRAELQHELLEKQYELQAIVVEITGQKDKIRRATIQANKTVKELAKLDTLDAELLQNDLRLRVTKEKYEFAISTLERFLKLYPNLLNETLEFLDTKGMYNLSQRLAQKVMSPSPSTSSRQSGTLTPYSTRSSAAVSGRNSQQSKKGSQRYSKEEPASRASTASTARKSVIVFETLTSKRPVKALLKNIALSVQAHGSSRNSASTATRKPRVTVTNAAGETGGISFGDLRKKLQEVVVEQLKQGQLDKVEEEPEPDSLEIQPAVKRSIRITEGTVELVDEKKDIDPESHDEFI